jgi:hypothetical protein
LMAMEVSSLVSEIDVRGFIGAQTSALGGS